jgi:hypothetical protein
LSVVEAGDGFDDCLLLVFAQLRVVEGVFVWFGFQEVALRFTPFPEGSPPWVKWCKVFEDKDLGLDLWCQAGGKVPFSEYVCCKVFENNGLRFPFFYSSADFD